MKLLLILLSVMTWTVESKNSVSLSESSTVPYDIAVSYSNTYQKGQVRAGDEAVLILGNLGGITVEKVEVYVKSNKSAGSGAFSVKVNGLPVAQQKGSFKDWFGKFDNENFHALSLLSEAKSGVNELEIGLKGTENSLSIEKYEITWAAAAPHSVTLMHGKDEYGTLTEEESMSGVLLPKLADDGEWKFAGWSEFEFWSMSEPFDMFYADTRYYPSSYCRLWAVYEWNNGQESIYMETPESGQYLYVNTYSNIAMKGVPENGKAGYVPVNIADDDAWYEVTFNATGDTAVIYHAESGTAIGYNGTKIASKESKWLVYHEGNKTAFYMNYGNKAYVLWPDLMDQSTFQTYAGLVQTSDVTKATTVLQREQTQEPPLYTCHPESQQAVELTNEGMNELGNERVVQFGIYELHIQGGKKALRIKN